MAIHSKHLRTVIDCMFRSENCLLVKHQVDSFDYFISDLIQDIVKQYNPITIYGAYNEELKKHEQEIQISFGTIALHPPLIYENDGSMVQMCPDIARLRSMSYSSNLHVDVIVNTTMRSGPKLDEVETREKIFEKILIGKIPIMVGSRYCNTGNNKTSKSGICKIFFL